MLDLLWLLLPVAAGSGYLTALKQNKKSKKKSAKTINSYNQQYIKGLNLVLNDDTDKAVDVLIDILSVDQDTVETHMALGSLFRRRGEVERALRIHQNVIARPNLCPEQRLEALIELGYDYLCAGVLDRSENIFKDIITHNPGNIKALKYLLDIYQRQKDWQSAIEAAKLLQKQCHISYSNNIAHYYCELTNIKIVQKNYEDADYYIKQALKYKPDSTRASLLIADLYIERAQIKKGIKIYFSLLHKNNKYLDIVLPKLIYNYNKYYFNNDSYLIRILDDLAETNPNILVINQVVEYLLSKKGYEYTWHILTRSIYTAASTRLLKNFVELIGAHHFKYRKDYETILNSLNKLLATQKNYHCKNCGFSYRQLLWLCPSCKNWDTLYNINAIYETGCLTSDVKSIEDSIV